MKRDVLVYLAGPITARDGFTVEENVASAVKMFRECLMLGVPAFCPQLDGAFPSLHGVPYETMMAYDFSIIDRCTHMLMLPRWASSPGATRERAYWLASAQSEMPTRSELRLYYTIEDLLEDLA